MKTVSEPLYLEKLQGAALELTEIPLWGSPPPFPFEELAGLIAEKLELESVKISDYKTDWMTREKYYEGMGKSPVVQTFTLSPLPGTYFWIMPSEAHQKLLEILLKLKGKTLSDTTLKEGFTTYVFLHILHAFNTLNPYGNLVAGLSESIDLPAEGALAIDLSISLNKTPFWGRILAPQDARASFKSHFTMESPPLLSDASFASMELPLQILVGSTTLSLEEWETVSLGDFVLLERCSYDASAGKGTAILTLGTTPLFDVRIKEGQMKLLEYALTQEDYDMTAEDEETQPTEGEEKVISPGKVPLQIHVEVGKIQMPLEKITQLKPGNVLELGMGLKPDVFLVASGKKIAKGELVSLGEAIGVKILKIGE